MKLLAFSLRDSASDSFGAPFVVPSEGLAKRVVVSMMGDRNSQVAQYPNDFMLFEIGAFETNTAELTAALPRPICSARACLPAPDPRQLMIPQAEALLKEAASNGK